MLMNFLKFALHSNSLFVQLVNWGDSVECIHSVATAGAFEHDSLSVAFEKRNWHSVSHGICTSARSGPMTTKSNLKNGEIANGKHCIHWELLNSPPELAGWVMGGSRVPTSGKQLLPPPTLTVWGERGWTRTWFAHKPKHDRLNRRRFKSKLLFVLVGSSHKRKPST